jgi:hypothetical protein
VGAGVAAASSEKRTGPAVAVRMLAADQGVASASTAAPAWGVSAERDSAGRMLTQVGVVIAGS